MHSRIVVPFKVNLFEELPCHDVSASLTVMLWNLTKLRFMLLMLVMPFFTFAVQVMFAMHEKSTTELPLCRTPSVDFDSFQLQFYQLLLASSPFHHSSNRINESQGNLYKQKSTT